MREQMREQRTKVVTRGKRYKNFVVISLTSPVIPRRVVNPLHRLWAGSSAVSSVRHMSLKFSVVIYATLAIGEIH